MEPRSEPSRSSTILDAGGNPVTSNVTNVTLTITTPAGAIARCTANPKTAVAGVATFAGCTIDKAGTYTLTATDAGLTDAVSSTVHDHRRRREQACVHDPAERRSRVLAAFATQPVVTMQDAGGNTVTADVSTVVLTLTTPGLATLACTGTTSKAAVAGVATFAGCNVDLAGTYTSDRDRRCVGHGGQHEPDDHRRGRGEAGLHHRSPSARPVGCPSPPSRS